MPDMDTGIERRQTDQGLTGDKIMVSDPAAAPVQTDAEAAGTPTSGAAIMATVNHLMETARKTPRPDTFGAWRQPNAAYQQRLGRISLLWVSGLVLLGLLAGWYGLP